MDEPKGSRYNLGLELPPHLALGESKDRVMLKTCAVMSIPLILGIAAIGWEALWQIIISAGTVLILHTVIQFWEGQTGRRVSYPTPASPLVLALIVGLSMPAGSPYNVTIGVAGLAMLVFKYLQGRLFTRKFVNPAAAAKAVLLTVLSLMVFLEDPLGLGMLYHPHHLNLDMISPAGFADAIAFYETDTLTAEQSLFFWKTHGWIGGASGVGTLVAGIIACFWIRLKWRIPLAFLLAMAVLSVGMALFTGGDPVSRIALHVFTGSTIFLAFFMATEPQSTPMPGKSQYLFGVALAGLTFVLQLAGVLGGSIIALVVLNLLAPLFDKIGHKRAIGMGGGI